VLVVVLVPAGDGPVEHGAAGLDASLDPAFDDDSGSHRSAGDVDDRHNDHTIDRSAVHDGAAA
jgi:hypothetical protein